MIKYQKVIKVGNSLAVTLDQGFVRQAGIKAGDMVSVSYKPEAKLFTVTTAKAGVMRKATEENELKAILSGKITPELEEWTVNFLKKNREALEALKDL